MKEKSTKKSTVKVNLDDVTGPKSHPLWNVAAILGMLLIAAGVLIPILSARYTIYRDIPSTFKYIYAAGALLLLVSRLFNVYKGKIMRIKRLHRIETWSAIFFSAGAFFLFYEPDITRNWIAFTLAGAAIQLYVSFMIPRTIRKALNGEVE
ncbi:MAG: hypothetical protein HDS69_04000 [Bacteroidales bacterium]|nr:hypothetical protein [Bacteroidales bacterium]